MAPSCRYEFVGDADLLPADARGDVAHTPVGAVPLARPAHGRVEVVIRPECIAARPGNDAVVETLTKSDETFLRDTLQRYLPKKAGTKFKKIVAGRKLWNFSKHERAVWKEAL